MKSIKAWLKRLRQQRPVVDHAVRTIAHFGAVNGSLQAGAVTYFAFLSFFPVLALAFFVVGQISRIYPQAQRDLVQALNQVFPDLVGGDGVPMNTIEEAAGAVAFVSIAGVLYAGLGWITAARDCLEVVFEVPAKEQPGFLPGKLRDLISLTTIGVLLLVSVAVAGLISGLAGLLLGWLGLDSELEWLIVLLARALGFAANVLLFFALFRLLGKPHTPTRSLWSGALLGAVAFEALKALSFLLLASTKNQPAFQAFGIALILVVWINYFSRVMLLAAAWAHTSPAARALRERDTLEADRTEFAMKELTHVELRETPVPTSGPSPRTAFAAGGAAMLGLVAMLRRRKDDS